MKSLYNVDEIRKFDEYAINVLGMPSHSLMESAANSIVNIIINVLNPPEEAIFGIICGKGNNGGDGFAVARLLALHGYSVRVICFGTEKDYSKDCRINYNILKKLEAEVETIEIYKYSSSEHFSLLLDCNIIVDAILGSGFRGELKEPYRELVEMLNQSPMPKIAIDVPTGLDADNGNGDLILNVDFTITLGADKKGLYVEEGYKNAGLVLKGDIGITPFNMIPSAYLNEVSDAISFIPNKHKDINKYTAGKVFVIAGSKQYTGAPILTSSAALKSGAGAVVLCTYENIDDNNIKELVYERYNNGYGFITVQEVDRFQRRIEWADCTIIGPGLGREEDSIYAVRKILKERNYNNLVLDADGLYAISNDDYVNYDLTNVVLTPHLNEFSKLINIPVEDIKKDLFLYGHEFAKKTNAILVLKGAPTIIFYKEIAVVNSVGNEGLAKFGTGDVLAGIIGSFIAQSELNFGVVISAVYMHSYCADLLKNKFTELGYTAGDLIKYFPAALKKIRRRIET